MLSGGRCRRRRACRRFDDDRVLPPVIQVAFGAFTVFAALKISYGASIPRTLALCMVPMVIVGTLAYLAHWFVPS